MVVVVVVVVVVVAAVALTRRRDAVRGHRTELAYLLEWKILLSFAEFVDTG